MRQAVHIGHLQGDYELRLASPQIPSVPNPHTFMEMIVVALVPTLLT